MVRRATDAFINFQKGHLFYFSILLTCFAAATKIAGMSEESILLHRLEEKQLLFGTSRVVAFFFQLFFLFCTTRTREDNKTEAQQQSVPKIALVLAFFSLIAHTNG